MNKLYIDGKLVGFAGYYKVEPPDQDQVDYHIHLLGECRTLPTYFCPVCAREAMRDVDLGNVMGGYGGPLK